MVVDELGVYGKVLLQSGNGMNFWRIEEESADECAGS
jgi:hypothetical protein